jgi:hypothetical protein
MGQWGFDMPTARLWRENGMWVIEFMGHPSDTELAEAYAWATKLQTPIIFVLNGIRTIVGPAGKDQQQTTM